MKSCRLRYQAVSTASPGGRCGFSWAAADCHSITFSKAFLMFICTKTLHSSSMFRCTTKLPNSLAFSCTTVPSSLMFRCTAQHCPMAWCSVVQQYPEDQFDYRPTGISSSNCQETKLMLTWFGHVTHHDSLSKTILQGTLEGE